MTDLKNETNLMPIYTTADITVLSEDDNKKLSLAKNNIEHSMKHVIMHRTKTLLRTSVLNDLDHPTPDSKYWQLSMEMYAHSTALADNLFEIESKQIDLDEAEEKLKTEKNNYTIRRLELEIKKIMFQIAILQKEVHERILELDNQSTAMEELKQYMNYSQDDMNEHQVQTYAIAWTNEVCNITDGTDSDSRKNKISRWITMMNLLESCGTLNEFYNSLSNEQRQKLIELKLISEIKK